MNFTHSIGNHYQINQNNKTMSIFPSEEDFLLRPLHEGESMPIDTKDQQIKELQTENAYLKAEFEANKEKVYTQEENGLIKQQSEKWKKLNADFDSAIGRASSKGYFDKLSLLPESFNPIATDHTTLEPNQTEAPKETIEALAEKEGIKDFLNSHLVPLDIKSAQFHFNQGRTTTIQEIEEWRNNKRKSLGKINDEHKEKIGKMIILDELLQTLKKITK